jgi:hypothetical protein
MVLENRKQLDVTEVPPVARCLSACEKSQLIPEQLRLGYRPVLAIVFS